MKKGNVVVKKVCHSRKFLSGIFHVLICYVHKGKSLFINDRYVEDPRLRASGMTPLFNNGGFTLIELLVVVLIIGILAAVAVPQYQLAIDKSHYTAMIPYVKALSNAQAIHYLANGYYSENDWSVLDINFPEGAPADEFNRPTIGQIKLETGENSAVGYYQDKKGNRFASYAIYHSHGNLWKGKVFCFSYGGNYTTRGDRICKAIGASQIEYSCDTTPNHICHAYLLKS